MAFGSALHACRSGDATDWWRRQRGLDSAVFNSHEVSHLALLRIEPRMMNIDSAPLKPVTLRHRIVEIIRQAITTGDLSPGDRIVELRLAKQLGVGNTAVREALFELERAGLVTRIPNKGSFITKTTLEDAQQIFRVRKELEGLAVELALEHMSAAYLDMLQGLVDAMKDRRRDQRFRALLPERSGVPPDSMATVPEPLSGRQPGDPGGASVRVLPHPHPLGLQGRSAGQRRTPSSTSREHQEPAPGQRYHDRFLGLFRDVLAAG